MIEKSLYKRKQSNIEDMIGDKKFIIILNINKMDIGFYVDRIINISTINIEDIVGLDPIIQTNLTNVNYINGIVKFKEKRNKLLSNGYRKIGMLTIKLRDCGNYHTGGKKFLKGDQK